MKKTKVSLIALWLTAIILCTFGILILTKQQNDKISSLTPFERVEEGMTEERVLELMGEPDLKFLNSYSYIQYGMIEFEESNGKLYVSEKLTNDEIDALLKVKGEELSDIKQQKDNSFSEDDLSGEKDTSGEDI